MSGDELVDPAAQTAGPIIIGAPSKIVWPWLVQWSSGRGRLSSNDDAAERLVDADIKNAETDSDRASPHCVGDIPWSPQTAIQEPGFPGRLN